MCQNRYINCKKKKKVLSGGGVSIMMEAMHELGLRIYGKPSSSIQFCCEPKTKE